MIDKWNVLSQNNKVALIIVILTALFAIFGHFGKLWFEPPSNVLKPASQVKQETSGKNSPAISGTNGDVTININRLDPEEQP